MTRILACLLVVFAMSLATAPGAHAQDRVFIQIEAHPSLTVAQTRARDYAARLDGVNGFSLGGGWYGIALGPYDEAQAGAVLRQLRNRVAIPRDSYIVRAANYRSQFYPVGANVLEGGAAPVQTTEAETEAETETPVATPPPPADETPAEARRSERDLTRAEREELQIALRWAGFYNAAIDGAFGRGTRGAMAAWQEANGFEVTGVLTTKQRAELLRQYNAVLDGMGLRVVTDEGAGIAMQIPTEVVAFDAYEYPFARYAPTGKVPEAQLLLISQAGDQGTLFGLYEIMQTLEIVPLDGPRERGSTSFRIEGSNGRIASYTEARLTGGAVKGFTLVWPAGDEERRSRVLEEMRESFQALEGSIDPSFVDDEAQAVDLLAGLQIRKPLRARSGVYVTSGGVALTVREAVTGCGRITLENDYAARVVLDDAETGLAVVAPEDALAPLGVATILDGTPRITAEVAVSGYSYEGALGGPTLTYGTLADIRGLRGEEDLLRLDLRALAGDAGGPVLDAAGNVMGVLLPEGGGARQLPPEVSFAVDAAALLPVLERAGVAAATAGAGAALDPARLTARARDMTALVSCWE